MKKSSFAAYENLEEILNSSESISRTGLGQYFTPDHLAVSVALPLPYIRPVALDWNMGEGALLSGIGALTNLGADIDPACARKPRGSKNEWKTICADVTRLYPLLYETAFEADLIGLNPPFSAAWHTAPLASLIDSKCSTVAEAWDSLSRHETIDSTPASLMMALDRLTIRGEGFMICNDATATRFFGSPESTPEKPLEKLRRHVWAWARVPAGVFPGVSAFTTAVLYFAADHDSDGPTPVFDCPAASPEAIRETFMSIATQRMSLRRGISMTSGYHGNKRTADIWDICAEEYRRLTNAAAPKDWNIWLDDAGHIRTHLTPFQNVSGKIPHELITTLHELKNQSPMALVVQKPSRLALQKAVHSDIWRVQPALIASVEKAIAQYNSVRAPFYPLNEVQRLGYLDEEDSILCKASTPAGLGHFEKGKRYELQTTTYSVQREKTKLNLEGEPEEVELTGQELKITLIDQDGVARDFVPTPSENEPGTLPVQELITYFEIPRVPDVAEVLPDLYQSNLAKLKIIEAQIAKNLTISS